MSNISVTAIIQARMGSTRFPKKVFAELAGRPLIWHVVNRLKYSQNIHHIVLATTDNNVDDTLTDWAKKENINVYRGSENNVLKRFYDAVKQYPSDIIVRVTADDPFKDPSIIDKVIQKLIDEKLDFAYNNHPPTFPEGLDSEVFTFSALGKAYHDAKDDYEKEHVTQYFYRNENGFKQANYTNTVDLSHLRWTIDTQKDYEMAQKIYDALYREDSIFLMPDILTFLQEYPEVSQINMAEKRSIMYQNR